jgi:hypothetical protein
MIIHADSHAVCGRAFDVAGATEPGLDLRTRSRVTQFLADLFQRVGLAVDQP